MDAACFSGHRPRPGLRFDPAEEESRLLARQVRGEILRLCRQGVHTYYCGMAQGFDLLCGEVALGLRLGGLPLSLVAALPFPGQEARWSQAWRSRYHTVLEAAQQRVVLGPAYRRGVYFERNRFMVEHSGALIGYWDGGPGGTAHTFSLAKAKGLAIVNLFGQSV